MSALSKLKQARNIDELASEIEPLAQAMANLVDETRQSLKTQQSASRAQAQAWSQAQAKTSDSWREAARDMQVAAQTLSEAAETANRAARGWTWRLWIGVLIASITPLLGLLIVSWIWLDPQILSDQGTTFLVIPLNGP